ncbi:cation transporter [Jannaschia sp. EhC01]|nr:cation transporter [Jannaschia sp. EhC01]
MFAGISLSVLIAVGIATAVVILLAGLRMTHLADRIADRTGWGEALVGGVLLGAATSFSGTIVSLTSALSGDASLAFSNSIGGIAAQTAFLGLADMLYRRANLEHAAAELTNMFQCGVLLLLLSVPFAAHTAPSFTIFAIHPVSLALVLIYAIGIIASARLRKEPMWTPVKTADTRTDTPDDGDDTSQPSTGLIVQFLGLMLIIGGAGWIVAQLASEMIERFTLSSSLVGAVMTAVVTSLPELVTTLAAVRRGALQLAVGGIIGGNTFDILFLTISDIGFREGSLYHAVGVDDLFWLSVAMVMTAILLLGLMFRQRSGPGRMGVESVALLAVYGGAIAIQAS